MISHRRGGRGGKFDWRRLGWWAVPAAPLGGVEVVGWRIEENAWEGSGLWSLIRLESLNQSGFKPFIPYEIFNHATRFGVAN